MSDFTVPLQPDGRVAELPREPYRGKLLINGEHRDSQDNSLIRRFSPAHNSLVGEYAKAGLEDTNAAISAARVAFDKGQWSGTSGAERADLLFKVADLIERDAERLAFQETLESGKAISQARDEMGWAAGIWRYAASSLRTLHGESFNTLGDDMLGFVMHEPVGVVSIITPWNFPLLIVSQKLPFALAAGCSCIVKPSELTSGTTCMLGDLLIEAGVPDGVVNIVFGEGMPVGHTLTTHPDVDMVSFTGSTNVGKAIVRNSADTLKRVSLELGGKNPQIIFPDCDWEAAVDAVVFGAYFNTGQCCNSGSRILLHQDIAAEFIKDVTAKAATIKVGDPLLVETKVGAIVSEGHLNVVSGFLEEAVSEGAQVVFGGQVSQDNGLYMAPTLLSNVKPSMKIAQQEAFGPILSCLTFSDIEEAIAIANSTSYGLSAGVWSRDINTCLAIGRRVRAGTVWMNSWMSGPAELPFGGFSESGLGREMGSHAIKEFTEVKTLQMHSGPKSSWWLPRETRT